MIRHPFSYRTEKEVLSENCNNFLRIKKLYISFLSFIMKLERN